MYIPAPFRTGDEEALAFAVARGFGTLIAVEDGRPVASHIPFLIERPAGRIIVACHVARANPLHEAIARHPRVLLSVMGPDAYVSPDWYVSDDQVSTWNYVSVHLSGVAHVLPPEAGRAHVDALSAVFEQRLLPKKPWTSDKMTPQKRDAMLRAIVPLEIDIDKIEAQWKLGQHKSATDQAGVLASWEMGDANARALAVIARRRQS